jgi:hypothetical protein
MMETSRDSGERAKGRGRTIEELGCESGGVEVNYPSVFRYYNGVRRTLLAVPLPELAANFTILAHWIAGCADRMLQRESSGAHRIECS